jgi:AraC-like DNA-binding protein
MKAFKKNDTLFIWYYKKNPLTIIKQLSSQIGEKHHNETLRKFSFENCDLKLHFGYRKITTGLWYSRIEKFYNINTKISFRKDSKTIFELDYLIVHDGDINRCLNTPVSLNGTVSFSSGINTSEWDIQKGTRATIYKFIFSRKFLEEYFFLNDSSIRNTAIEKVINLALPVFERRFSLVENNFLQQLDGIFYQQEPHFIRNFSGKNIATQLFQNYFETELNASASDTNSEMIFGLAINVMKQHLDEGFPGLETLAALCNVSVPTFKRKFKGHYHITPEQYFRKLQIDLATDLLRRGDTTVREVAASLGYVDLQSFGRVFKKIKGFPPSAYKKSIQ